MGPGPKSDVEPSSLTTDLLVEGVEREGEAADKTGNEGIYLKQMEGKLLREKSVEGKPHQHGRE